METRLFLRIIQGFVAATAMILVLCSGTDAQVKYKTLHTFRGTDGELPTAGVIFDAAGNLYGTTSNGGLASGIVFKLSHRPDGSWKESVLHNFESEFDGLFPEGGLIFDETGNLFGTTREGGGNCYCGTVFELTPEQDGSWMENTLYRFTGGSDSGNPSASLIFDKGGNLYGTTGSGGSLGNGTVFKLTTGPNKVGAENVLYSFVGGSDGGSPYGALLLDSLGNLYGTTAAGGSFGNGTVFKLTPDQSGGWTESVLHSFTGGPDGGDPWSNLIFDKAGSLYGTTVGGGYYHNGVIFKLKSNRDGNWTEQVIHSFNNKDGGFPYAGLVFDATGNIYGTTFLGGVYQNGVVFELKAKSNGGWNYRLLYSFRSATVSGPSSLIVDAAGNLYGTTYGDGSTTFGSVFEITP
jgi:uncharacterized repeat protein (TIGR03803 family)